VADRSAISPSLWADRVRQGFWFLVYYAATQLATQLRQRCIQVVCRNAAEDQNRRGAPLLTSIPQFQKRWSITAPVCIPDVLEWIVVPPVDLFKGSIRQPVRLPRTRYACLQTNNARCWNVSPTFFLSFLGFEDRPITRLSGWWTSD